MLLSGLPVDSRLKARLAKDYDGHRWSQTDHILATVADFVQQTNRLLIAQVSQGKQKPPPFERHPRPGVQARNDVDAMKETLAYRYLRDLRPGGPGETTSSPLRLVHTADEAAEPGPPSPRPTPVVDPRPGSPDEEVGQLPSDRVNDPPDREDVD